MLTNGEIKSRKNEPSAHQHKIADILFELSGAEFLKDTKAKSGYITLDVQIGKSKKNKNAVSVLRDHVRFMIRDWAFENKAKLLDPPINTQRNEQLKKLEFPHLTASIIEKHPTFFQSLLEEAKQESRYRQGH